MATVIVADREIVVGVDTHNDLHVAVVLDDVGTMLGAESFSTSEAGFRRLVEWAEHLGRIRVVGIEGSGSFGATLTRYLLARGYAVVEVARPNRQLRRAKGKSDPIDAEAAARSVLSGEATGVPKRSDGTVEMIRALRVARASAMKARTQALNQILALVLTAPASLRARLRDLPNHRLVEVAAAFRPGPMRSPEAATKLALRHLAHRHVELTGEIDDLDGHIGELLVRAAPRLMALHGVGPEVGAALVVAAGENVERLRSESSFARICGAAPLPASSGRTTRHRLNRGGNRSANNALWRIVIVRLRRDSRTQLYMERRTQEGMSKQEIIRCLKRYVAREVFAALQGVDGL
jgi:transposase